MFCVLCVAPLLSSPAPQLVPEKARKTLQSLEAVMDAKGSYRKYRKTVAELRANQSFVLLYLGTQCTSAAAAANKGWVREVVMY